MLRPLLLTLLLAPALLAQPGLAIDGCKLKTGKDGTLFFKAKNIEKTPGDAIRYYWTRTPGDVAGGTFSNEGSCVVGQDTGMGGISNGRAKNCTLGPEGSLRSLVPPDTCELTVVQSGADPATLGPDDSCTAHLKGCTPGARPVCPPGTDRVGSFCIESRLRGPGTLLDASAVCHAQGRSVCSWQALSQCDHLNIGGCGGNTDGPRSLPLLVTDTAAEDGDNLFNRILSYEAIEDGGSNDAAELNDDQDDARFHCCQPISGPLDPASAP
jgi:hypothetical protein